MSETKGKPMRVIIVDDENAAISNLREVIDSFEQLTVVAEIKDGKSAIAEIRRQDPDVVFLDIEMPEVGGFEVADATADMNYQLVFVTAFDQYALDAFATNAIDYLLKPVRPRILDKCIRKILRQESVVLEGLENQKSDSDSLVLSDSNGIRVLNYAHVSHIEGIGRYRRIHLTAVGRQIHNIDTILSDTTLDEFEQQLSRKAFMRIHRGFIVSLGCITRVVSESRRQLAELDGVDLKIPVSRGRATALKDLLKG